MNAHEYGDDIAEPRDDAAVKAAFAAYRADAPAAFVPPPVDDLIMSSPASLRKRRLASLAAVVGACTVVTAGGFAVAQTIGSLPSAPEEDAQATVAHDSPASDHTGDDTTADPATPEAEDEAPAMEDTAVPEGTGQTLAIDEWTGVCEGGTFGVDPETWAFTDETEWTVAAEAAGDLTGDGTPESVLALTCGEQTAVAAFTPTDEGLDQLAWVWQPDESQRFSEIAGVADGVITLQGLGAASATWTARYEWDGAAFVSIDDAPTTAPSSSETTATPDSGETQTTPASPPTDGQVS